MKLDSLMDFFNKSISNDKFLYEILLIVLGIEAKKDDSSHSYDILGRLAIIFNIKDLYKFVSVFEGTTFKIPSLDKLIKIIKISVCYYLRNIEGKSWDEIRKITGWEINGYSMLNYFNKIRRRLKSEEGNR